MARTTRYGVATTVAVTLVLGGTVWTAGTASAVGPTVYEVTTTSACTLQDAVAAANTDTAVGSCPAGGSDVDRIVLGPGSFDGPIVLSGPLSVLGSGPAQTTIDGRRAGTTVTVSPGSGAVALSGVTITGGGSGAADGAPGGVLVQPDADLSLLGVVVTGNTGNPGVDRFSPGGTPGGDGGAGGIRNDGILFVAANNTFGQSVVRENTGGRGGQGSPGVTARGTGGSGAPGGRGGTGGIESGGLLSLFQAQPVTGNVGGPGGTGGRGGVSLDLSSGCANGAPGGPGGPGGTGGVHVVDGSSVGRGPAAVSGNTPGPGGSGGRGSSPSGSPCTAGSSGAPGASGVADVRRGGQTVSLTAPQSAEAGSSFLLGVSTSSPRFPDFSAEGACSIDAEFLVTLAADGAGRTCTVTVSLAEDDWYTATSASVTVSIVPPPDTTPPTLAPTLSAASPVILGGPLTVTPNATDTGSGVASQSCGTPDTTTIGTRTVTCTATDAAGNTASVDVPYTVAAFLGAWVSPLPKTTLVKSASSIPVKFTLRSATGPVTGAAARALASGGRLRATLSGPGRTGPVVATSTACTWVTTSTTTGAGFFRCTVKTPKGLLTGARNPYLLTAEERGSTGPFFTVPGGTTTNPNPKTLYVR